MSPVSPSSPITVPASKRGIARFGDGLFAFVTVLWLGFLLGISFVATPVKFQAPSLDLPTALDVGRVTFALSTRIEWALFASVGFAAFFSSSARHWRLTSIGVLAIVLLMQHFWLLPILDERVGNVLAGETVSATHHHFFYIIADSLKAAILLALSVAAFCTRDPRREGAQCA